MNRVVCIGNRFVDGDDAGCRVFDHLAAQRLADVELIDGGIAGLGLLRAFEGAERVAVVDQAKGFAEPGQVVALPAAELSDLAQGPWDHAAGLPHLLRAVSLVCDGPPPQILVVGLHAPCTDEAVERAAALALQWVRPHHSAQARISSGGAQ